MLYQWNYRLKHQNRNIWKYQNLNSWGRQSGDYTATATVYCSGESGQNITTKPTLKMS